MDKPELRASAARLAVAVPFFLLCGCAASPLYTAGHGAVAVTSGEIPRDSRGEPVWHLIRAAPAQAPASVEDPRRGAMDVGEGSGGFPPPR